MRFCSGGERTGGPWRGEGPDLTDRPGMQRREEERGKGTVLKSHAGAKGKEREGMEAVERKARGAGCEGTMRRHRDPRPTGTSPRDDVHAAACGSHQAHSSIRTVGRSSLPSPFPHPQGSVRSSVRRLPHTAWPCPAAHGQGQALANRGPPTGGQSPGCSCSGREGLMRCRASPGLARPAVLGRAGAGEVAPFVDQAPSPPRAG